MQVLKLESLGNAYTIIMVLIAVSSLVVSLLNNSIYKSYQLPAVLLSIGLMCTALGELFWAYYVEILDIQIPYPSIADVWFVLFYPVTFIALSTLSVYLTVTDDKRKALLTLFKRLIIFFIVSGIALSMVLYTQNYDPAAVSNLARLFDYIYLICDALLLVHIILLVFIVIIAPKKQPVLVKAVMALVLGVTLLLLADSLFAYSTDLGTFEDGGYIDLLFLLSTYFISISVIKLRKASV